MHPPCPILYYPSQRPEFIPRPLPSTFQNMTKFPEPRAGCSTPHTYQVTRSTWKALCHVHWYYALFIFC